MLQSPRHVLSVLRVLHALLRRQGDRRITEQTENQDKGPLQRVCHRCCYCPCALKFVVAPMRVAAKTHRSTTTGLPPQRNKHGISWLLVSKQQCSRVSFELELLEYITLYFEVDFCDSPIGFGGVVSLTLVAPLHHG